MSDIPLAADWVASAMAGAIVAGPRGRTFTGVSIDTRSLKRGELFFGIRGERFDGAAFAASAVEAGAAGVVVPRGGSVSLDLSMSGGAAPVVIEVDDTTAALQALAHTVRIEAGTKVVAITGSAGKTTTKEVTADFLSARYRVVRNRGNFNNHIGLPLSLIELRERPDVAVVELGMNHAGEISTLVRIAAPDVRVWTNVGEAHLGFFGSVERIADAKAEILERATRQTLLVANADDERIVRRSRQFAGRTVTFGIDRPADVRATEVIDNGIEGVTARVETRRGAAIVRTQLVGRTNLANVLAGAAVALELDVPLEAIVDRASRLRPAANRGEIVRLRNGVTLIDDSYNANPTATIRALEVLGGAAAKRRVAVLGEMLELGDSAAALHRDVGRAAARARVDFLITVGGESAAALGEAAVAAGLAAGRVRHFAASEEAASAALAFVESGDLVLVKGSHGVRTDRVVERLKVELG